MKIKFSRMERAAGLFVLLAFGGFVFFTAVVAVKQGWFEPKYYLKTKFARGEGLHAGTLVQIAGLRAGLVDSVKLTDDNSIEVRFSVTYDFFKRIKGDSVAKVIRPFVIGDKVVEVTVGSKDLPGVAENTYINTEETMDLMDLLGGGKLGPFLATIDGLLKNLRVVIEAFTDPKRSEALIEMFDEALPTLKGIKNFTAQVTKGKRLDEVMNQVSKLTRDLNTMAPAMLEFAKVLPELGQNSVKAMEQLTKMTDELNKVLPVLASVAPQLPEATQRSVDALREAVVVLKAMQKSFLLRSSVKEVKEEEEAAKRAPASHE